MFRQHVTRELSAYLHGELSVDEASRVREHLDRCAACRKEYDEIKFGVRLAEMLPTRTAPNRLWDQIESALVQQTTPQKSAANNSSREARLWSFFPLDWRRAVAVCSILLLAFAAGGFWFYTRTPRSAWEVASLEGAPMIDSDRIESMGRLGVGDWLETDATSRAKIKVADIGEVEVDPRSRLRLIETRETEHRLELARGRMHAMIFAPPRLFFVNTPSAVAADLGCAYTLEVDDKGRSHLHVTSGWVALEAKDRESFVPADGICITEPGIGPGTPFFEDASDALKKALAKFDFENGATAALDIVLSEARPRDTLTLWHLLSRVDADNRSRVFERIIALSPLPEGITRDGIMRLDKEMLASWKDEMKYTW